MRDEAARQAPAEAVRQTPTDTTGAGDAGTASGATGARAAAGGTKGAPGTAGAVDGAAATGGARATSATGAAEAATGAAKGAAAGSGGPTVRPEAGSTAGGRKWSWRVSQPEMRPEETARQSAVKRDRRRGDLLGRAFPGGDWEEPAERLDELYQWVEQGALGVVDWYLADRRWKRRAARTLRFGTAVGLTAGATLPLLELTDTFGNDLAPWGFVALLGAAACAGCDRWFGLTSGWMRSVATAQAVQRRLETLQYDWATESIREVLGPTEGTASEAAERCLGVLRRFAEDVTEIVRAETVDWIVEFRTSPAALRAPSGGSGSGGAGGRTDGGPITRFPLLPGTNRPNMPRQRPPDGSR